MSSNRDNNIISVITNNPSLSSRGIWEVLKGKHKDFTMSYATLKRRLNNLTSDNLISAVGKGRGTKYIISQEFQLLYPLDVEEYFAQDMTKREAKTG